MALLKSTNFAPDIYKALNGLLLIYKPARLVSKELVNEIKERISNQLNAFQPRPLENKLQIVGQIDDDKQIVQVPNLADHPLVVGPRYVPWEVPLTETRPRLGYLSSGLSVLLIGDSTKYWYGISNANLISTYQITGKFGHVTDTHFSDGKVIDKSTYKNISIDRIDSVLAKIQSTQHERLFDSSKTPIDSQEAYELAKAWPSRAPQSAKWPVIYRIRCIHLKKPEFKIEVTCRSANEALLAHLLHDIGLMCKSGAYTEAIRRVKLGPFNIEDGICDRDWDDLQAIVDNIHLNKSRLDDLLSKLSSYKGAGPVRETYEFKYQKSKS